MRKPLGGGAETHRVSRESLQKWRKVIWSAWTGLAHPGPSPHQPYRTLTHYSSSHKGRTWWTRLNTPGNGAPDAMTEINFGLHSAGSGRLARHGRLRQGSTCLRTAIIRDAGMEALGALDDARAFEAVLSCLIDLNTLTKSVPTPVKRRLTLHPPDAASASQFRRVLVASMLAEQATRP